MLRTEALTKIAGGGNRKISVTYPEALFEMKKIIWEGTEQWESILIERAKITGKLVLSDFTKKALLQFKK